MTDRLISVARINSKASSPYKSLQVLVLLFISFLLIPLITTLKENFPKETTQIEDYYFSQLSSGENALSKGDIVWIKDGAQIVDKYSEEFLYIAKLTDKHGDIFYTTVKFDSTDKKVSEINQYLSDPTQNHDFKISGVFNVYSNSGSEFYSAVYQLDLLNENLLNHRLVYCGENPNQLLKKFLIGVAMSTPIPAFYLVVFTLWLKKKRKKQAIKDKLYTYYKTGVFKADPEYNLLTVIEKSKKKKEAIKIRLIILLILSFAVGITLSILFSDSIFPFVTITFLLTMYLCPLYLLHYLVWARPYAKFLTNIQNKYDPDDYSDINTLISSMYLSEVYCGKSMFFVPSKKLLLRYSDVVDVVASVRKKVTGRNSIRYEKVIIVEYRDGESDKNQTLMLKNFSLDYLLWIKLALPEKYNELSNPKI